VDDNLTSGTFSLCIDNEVDYDFKSKAVDLTDMDNWCSGDAIYDNTFATADQSQGSCWTGTTNKNVWFKFTASTGFIKVLVKTGGVYGTMQRQQVAVWTAAGTEVACTKWVANQGTITLQTDALSIGNTYYISVDDDLVSGTFSLCVDDSINYDYKAGAVLLTDKNNWCSGDAIYDNTFATADQSQGSCWTGATNKNVWFKFQAGTSFIKIQVKTGSVYGTMQRQQVSLWTAAGAEVACTKWVANQGTISLQTNTLTIGNIGLQTRVLSPSRPIHLPSGIYIISLSMTTLLPVLSLYAWMKTSNMITGKVLSCSPIRITGVRQMQHMIIPLPRVTEARDPAGPGLQTKMSGLNSRLVPVL
jgi:hypothetical protein